MGNENFIQELRGSNLASLLLCILLAFTCVFVSPYRASNLPICTDSVEYAIGAANIVETGRFFIRIQGEELPSRYPPWFSLIAIAPACLIFGCEPGNAIIPILLFSIIGVITAFLLGHRISGMWGGFASASILILLPAYRAYSQHVMTEIPCSALALFLCLIYLDMRKNPTASVHLFAIAGIGAGIASAFRPACAAFVLPFLPLAILPLNKLSIASVWRASLLLLPQIVIAGSTLAYNYKVFGSFTKNGYNFWCPEIFSSFKTVFSPSFLWINIPELFISGLPALALAACCLWIGHTHSRNGFPGEKCKMAKSLLYYLVTGTGPIVLLHLFYFWYDQRFFLPSLAILAALTGGLLGLFFENAPYRRLLAVQIVVLFAALTFRLVHPPANQERRNTAERIIKTTPANSLIISCIDPVYLEYFTCRNTERRVLPLTRNVDYTSAAVTWRTPGGLYPYVAGERPDKLAEEIRRNIPVFMDTSRVLSEDMDTVQKISSHFNLIQKAEYLYELGLKQ